MIVAGEERVRQRARSEGYISSSSSDSSDDEVFPYLEEVTDVVLSTLRRLVTPSPASIDVPGGMIFPPIIEVEEGDEMCLTPFSPSPTKEKLKEEWESFADLYERPVEQFLSSYELYPEERAFLIEALRGANAEVEEEELALASMHLLRAGYVHVVLRRGRSYTV